MQRFEPTFFVPYWRFANQSAIPDWIAGFKPTGVIGANGKPVKLTRNPGKSSDPNARQLPTSQTIQATILSAPDYTTFTLALEGAQPYGGHNLVHMWVNGTMSNVPTAPADPLFWMLHAEVDRLWSIWQQSHAGQNPGVTGADAILDPWPEQVGDVLTTGGANHPYAYDSMQL
jgi:tyrosinase